MVPFQGDILGELKNKVAPFIFDSGLSDVAKWGHCVNGNAPFSAESILSILLS